MRTLGASGRSRRRWELSCLRRENLDFSRQSLERGLKAEAEAVGIPCSAMCLPSLNSMRTFRDRAGLVLTGGVVRLGVVMDGWMTARTRLRLRVFALDGCQVGVVFVIACHVIPL